MMQLHKTIMPKKCDFGYCANIADYYFLVGAKGNIFICEHCLKQLKKTITGELNGKKE